MTITNDLRWNTHVSNVWTKANRTLGFLRRNLHSCPQEVKEAAYKGLVRPVLEYGSSVWDPSRCSSSGRIRKRAKAHSQIRDRKLQIWNWEYDWHSWTIKMGIPQEKEEDNRFILLYKGLKGKASIPTEDHIPKTRRGRNQHWKAFQTPLLIQNFINVPFPPDYQELECPPRFSDLICWSCRGLCCWIHFSGES